MTQLKPAEVFPPGEFLKEEIDARGWTQTDLAEILGRPVATVNEIIAAKRRVTPDTAKGLAAALGTSAELWMNLEAAYQLSRVQFDEVDPIGRRARVYSYAPVKEMMKRGWIERAESVDILEIRVNRFFGVDSLDEEPPLLAHAARMTVADGVTSTAQRAWLVRVQQVASIIDVATYSAEKLKAAVSRLRDLLPSQQEVRHIPRILRDAGVRFVIVEALQGTKIDGASMWLDAESPVIALTLRHNRIDNMWFVLMHEIGHILMRHGMTVDVDLDSAVNRTDKPETERVADEFASSTLIPGERLDSFIARVKPIYSTQRILGFAQLLGVHPGIVVGQLHHRREVVWANFRRMLVPVRDILTSAALTDGWGAAVPVPI